MVAGNRQTWTSRQRPTYPTRPRLQPLLLVAPHAQGPTSQLALPLPLNPSASAQSATSLRTGNTRGVTPDRAFPHATEWGRLSWQGGLGSPEGRAFPLACRSFDRCLPLCCRPFHCRFSCRFSNAYDLPSQKTQAEQRLRTRTSIGTGTATR